MISTRLAALAGVEREELPTTFYACVTRMLGCTATATETASVSMGHDRLFNYAVLTCDWSDPGEVARRLREELPDTGMSGERDAAIQGIVDQFETIGEGAGFHCVQAMMLTERLPLPRGVPDLLSFIWSLCDLYLSSADEVLDGLDAPTSWDIFLDAEPVISLSVGADELATVAETYADFADQKSGWFAGHSRRVAALATTAAAEVGMPEDQQRALTLAGLLHDIGCAAVHNGIWEKPGELTPHERQLVESHSYHTERS